MLRAVMLFALTASMAAGLGRPGSAVRADDKKDEAKAKAGRPVEDIDNLAAALAMIDYGRQKKVPEALIVAARVIGTTDYQKFDKADIQAVKGSKLAETEPALMAGQLLEEALKMSPSDEVKKLAEATKQAVAEFKRSPTNGPRTITGRMGPGDSSDTFKVHCRGGESTRVLVYVNPNYGDVDVEVIEENTFKVVAYDRKANANCDVSFFAGKAGNYLIRLRNHRDKVAVSYTMYVR